MIVYAVDYPVQISAALPEDPVQPFAKLGVWISWVIPIPYEYISTYPALEFALP